MLSILDESNPLCSNTPIRFAPCWKLRFSSLRIGAPATVLLKIVSTDCPVFCATLVTESNTFPTFSAPNPNASNAFLALITLVVTSVVFAFENFKNSNDVFSKVSPVKPNCVLISPTALPICSKLYPVVLPICLTILCIPSNASSEAPVFDVTISSPASISVNALTASLPKLLILFPRFWTTCAPAWIFWKSSFFPIFLVDSSTTPSKLLNCFSSLSIPLVPSILLIAFLNSLTSTLLPSALFPIFSSALSKSALLALPLLIALVSLSPSTCRKSSTLFPVKLKYFSKVLVFSPSLLCSLWIPDSFPLYPSRTFCVLSNSRLNALYCSSPILPCLNCASTCSSTDFNTFNFSEVELMLFPSSSCFCDKRTVLLGSNFNNLSTCFSSFWMLVVFFSTPFNAFSKPCVFPSISIVIPLILAILFLLS